jgi:hypothetical protein
MKDQMKETSVQKTASLHEKAVQAIASGEVDPVSTRRRSTPQKAVSPAVDKHIKVNPLVWVRAQELLAGSYTRIEIIDETTVVVR